jgi:L-fuconate dehydratase
VTRITDVEVLDVRFPTSRQLDGSDAMNPDPDYSAAYVVLHTDADDGLEGHGFTFTIGRGTEVVCVAIDALRPLFLHWPIEDACADMGAFWKTVTRDSQLRWIGPEKGAIHLATAAVVNAMWDLFAKREGKPLWRLLADMSPQQLVGLVDWRYLTDALTPDEAVDLLRAREDTRSERVKHLQQHGLPSYTTSAGWLGYDDEKLRRLCQEAVDEGWSHVKLKVGADVDNDVRRCRIAREILGPHRKLMVDANQAWDVPVAIANMRRLAEFDPWWIEEPTSPDDILGHAAIARAIAPIRVATGEHVHNRVMFKQLLQTDALGFCQIDACRLGGVNEAIAVQLMAAKYGVPVCPHAGGVGLCELVQHLSAFDFVAVSGSLDDVVVEYVDHLHEHFVDPVQMRGGRYVAPQRPGYSAEIRRETLERFRFPDGPEWAGVTTLAPRLHAGGPVAMQSP